MGSTEADHINTPGIPRVLMAKDPIDVIKNYKCDHSVHTKNHYDKTIRNSYNVRPESLDTQKMPQFGFLDDEAKVAYWYRALRALAMGIDTRELIA